MPWAAGERERERERGKTEEEIEDKGQTGSVQCAWVSQQRYKMELTTSRISLGGGGGGRRQLEVTAANFEWMGSSSRKSIVDCVVRSIGLERGKRKEGRETLGGEGASWRRAGLC